MHFSRGLILCTLLVFGGMGISCDRAVAKKAPKPDLPPKAVRTTVVDLRPMERTLPVVGTLAAYDEVIIAAQVAGQIEKFHADLGDRAKAGQELALIDTTSYDALAAQAAANLTKAQAAAANAMRNLKRVQDLQKDKIASPSELDQALADSGSANAEVKFAEASSAIAKLNLDRSRVKAPFDGAVALRISSPGGYVAIGAPILRFVKTDPLRLRLDVPERLSIGVKEGQVVRVTVEGDTNIYSGKLSRVAPALRDVDRMLAVEADVPPQGSLRPGLFARAEIVVNEHENTLSVPANSLVVFAGLEKVVTVKDNKAAEKVVTTGRRTGDWVEIVTGLQKGDTIVLNPTGIRTGQPLNVDGVATNSSSHGDRRSASGQ